MSGAQCQCPACQPNQSPGQRLAVAWLRTLQQHSEVNNGIMSSEIILGLTILSAQVLHGCMHAGCNPTVHQEFTQSVANTLLMLRPAAGKA